MKLRVLKYVFKLSALVSLMNIPAYSLDLVANSGTDEDIQAAVDLVISAGGGTVYIPEGTFEFNGRVKSSDGVNIIGAGEDKTILEGGGGQFVVWTPQFNSGFRWSGFTLKDGSSMEIDRCHDVRIDHITIDAVRSGYGIRFKRSHSSVIEHCTVKVDGSFYGIMVSYSELPSVWEEDVSKMLGSSKAIFIEDCTFEQLSPGSSHMTIGHTYAHYVVRHCTAAGPAVSHTVDAHGGGFGEDVGTRLMEIYENNFDADPQDGKNRSQVMAIRGGGAVVFKNTFTRVRFGIGLVLESALTGDYPILGQPKDIWIWNNTFTELEEGDGIWITSWGNPYPVDDYIQRGRDVFLRAPSDSLDGFTYTPFTYPHPLSLTDTMTTSIPENLTVKHESFSLSQNYPNPFNPITMINYHLPVTNDINLSIYNLIGQKVATLVNERQGAGNHQVEWDASDFPSGVYYFKIMTNNFREVKKMVLVK